MRALACSEVGAVSGGIIDDYFRNPNQEPGDQLVRYQGARRWAFSSGSGDSGSGDYDHSAEEIYSANYPGLTGGAWYGADGRVNLPPIVVYGSANAAGGTYTTAGAETGWGPVSFGAGTITDNSGNVYGTASVSLGRAFGSPVTVGTGSTIGNPADVLPGAGWQVQVGATVLGGSIPPNGANVNQGGVTTSVGLSAGVTYTSGPTNTQGDYTDGYNPGGDVSDEWIWVDPYAKRRS